jgi:uncharacterized coiled-coil protein SlyX
MLHVTQEFREYIAGACSAYKRGWKYITEHNLLDNASFMMFLERHNYNVDECECSSSGMILEGIPDSPTKWKQVIAVIKKLKDMQPEVQSIVREKPLHTLRIPEENPVTIEMLEKRIESLETRLNQCFYIISELRDTIDSLRSGPTNKFSDVDDFTELLGLDEGRHTPEELEEMRNASMDDFESMIRTGEKRFSSSSMGVIDHHASNMADSSRDKGNEISSEPSTVTSVVYDESDPTVTKREVELREAKQAVEHARKEKGVQKDEHPNSDEERKQRWIEAIRKDRIRRGLGVDISTIQKDGFECDDPNNSIFE